MKQLIITLITLFTAFGSHAATWRVDANYTADSPHDGRFRSLDTALREAERVYAQRPFSAADPLTIEIAPSVYWLDNPDDPAIRRPRQGENIPYGMELTFSNVKLVGLGKKPDETVLACNRGQTQGAVGNFTMLHFTGSDIALENLTLGNYCNVDLDYLLNPTLSRKRRATPIVQAQLAICNGDRYTARRCRFVSRLNLCPLAGAKRVLFEECHFECTDDALCGTGVYLNCDFTFHSSKPFYATSPQGAVFLNCDLHSLCTGLQHLVKAGSTVSMIDCRWTSDDPDLYISWTSAPTPDLRSYQSNLTLNGKPLTINAREPQYTVDVTMLPLLRAYKCGDIYNVANLLGGSDGWDPLGQSALGLPRIPTVLHASTRKASLEAGRDTLVIAADAPDAVWSVKPEDAAYFSIISQREGKATVTSTNNTESPYSLTITAKTPSGCETAVAITALPATLPAPLFTKRPRLVRSSDTLRVEYAIERGNRADRSLVAWYSASRADGSDAIPVKVTRGDAPADTYTLTQRDCGRYIFATVAPRHSRSATGAPEAAKASKKITSAASQKSLNIDFEEFASDYQPKLIPGLWTMDAFKPLDCQEWEWDAATDRAWHYGEGVDGARGVKGLMQSVRGARLMYSPVSGERGDMSLSIEVAPCKPAAQGFGSATGQYMDFCISFDPTTLTGYGLRVVRTVRHDKAVEMLLVKYDHSVVTPLTDPVAAICFVTGCRIDLTAKGETLTARVSNSRELTPRPGYATEVNLSAPIAPLPHGGIAIQHTGTVGASATLLRSLSAKWE